MKNTKKVVETLETLSGFVSAMPYETDGMEAVYAILNVLRKSPKKYETFCKAVCEEMDDGQDEDSCCFDDGCDE